MSLTKKITDIARQLRREQTEEENKLWQQVRNRKLNGLKFLRQHPVEYQYVQGQPYFFIADFYCDEKKLIIEVDGKVHDFQKDFDQNRDTILASLGLVTLRIKNEELVDVYEVLKKIREFITDLPPSTHPRSHVVRSSPSLQRREGVTSRSEVGGELAILLLAAGSSSRMGRSKQLLPIQGEPLLLRTTKAALQSQANNTVVVLGANAEKHEAVIKHLPVTIIVNEEWEKGMGSSLKAGLNHLVENNPGLRAVMILVCDQPLLTTQHLNRLINTYKETQQVIVASFYSDSSGVPALFDRSLFSDLLLLDNSHGAKKIIVENRELVYAIDFPEGATDLDTWEEYLRFKNDKD